MKNTEKKQPTTTSRAGRYSLIIIAVVICIVIMANVFMSVLPADVTQIDTSATQILTLSEQTNNIVENADKDITIYWIVQSGQENPNIKHLIDKYASLNNRITIVKKDPDVAASFVKQYAPDGANNNSLIVTTNDKHKYVDYYSIYEYSYDTSSGSQDYNVTFNGENALTSAIAYVTGDNNPKIYITTGHGEASLPDNFVQSISNANIETEEISLIQADKIPEDANCILINAPTTDISDNETQLLKEYQKNGGNIFIVSGLPEQSQTFTNIYALVDEYGVSPVDGLVVEGDSSCYGLGVPYNLLPIMTSHVITDPLINNGYYVMLPVSQGMKVAGYTEASITKLLTTSESSFAKADGYNLTTYEKEANDIDGPFTIGVAIEDNDSKIVLVSSAYLTNENADSTVSGGNQNFFMNTVNWMCEQENSIAIQAKNVSAEYLMMDSNTATILSIIFIALIPAAIIIVGLIVWIKRKNK